VSETVPRVSPEPEAISYPSFVPSVATLSQQSSRQSANRPEQGRIVNACYTNTKFTQRTTVNYHGQIYKGWIKTELDGQGAIVMRAGSAWIQPPRIEHVVLDYSNDCEVLEVILPADFATVELDEPPVPSRRQ